ncbi:flagellar assembly peptidoglycan hydrolase FlgJ [Pokkaliibacter sp. MBI-7]|uniref:flagellar assembly peptidoglycan hydrolase FlgJ n=1 Tax=Pokkaliibacter sp. MBI-7 TaxID=3040600 RepID=UPI00244B61AB|nr:flagellar assembly peptidoglycan hydrolase FlgJ [Pokkaliibacter sp. MBI-7]MDH2431317.1 flagellar assembly peptidoglycan hydrolase FlgJ [Pokkaliibacter sp. MBI-7]
MIGQTTSQSQVFTDLNRLQSLQHEVKSDQSPEAIKKVAQQFESLFVNQMLKSMREANQSINPDGVFNSSEMNFYQDMLDQQMGINISESGGIGLSDFLTRQLTHGSSGTNSHSDSKKDVTQVDSSIRHFLASHGNASSSGGNSNLDMDALYASLMAKQGGNSVQGTGSFSSAYSSDGGDIDSADEFVQALYPEAKQVADSMGADPRYLLAQAALESGWGQRMILNEDGSNSHNLFGIKANGNWDGKTTATSTLEYRNGVPVRENAYFRSYDSYADSFADYLSFLKQNGRYQQALANSTNGEAYVQELQKAGYATDPNYASKISQIARSDRMNSALGGLNQL